jgi:HSP20 family molecular chaperone IbpA
MSIQNASAASVAQDIRSGILILTDPTVLCDPFEDVARRAYELFELRGCHHGHDIDDWLRAEAELLRPVPIEISQSGEDLTIRAMVLGFWANELKVCIESNRVTITGKKEVDPQMGNKTTFIEWSPDTIFCRVALPMAVAPHLATAFLGGGVLEINLHAAHAAE